MCNVTSSERTRIGSLLVGRPLPVGENHRSFGGFVPITRPMVTPFLDAIASADAFEVAATYSLLFLPPPSQPAQQAMDADIDADIDADLDADQDIDRDA